MGSSNVQGRRLKGRKKCPLQPPTGSITCNLVVILPPIPSLCPIWFHHSPNTLVTFSWQQKILWRMDANFMLASFALYTNKSQFFVEWRAILILKRQYFKCKIYFFKNKWMTYYYTSKIISISWSILIWTIPLFSINVSRKSTEVKSWINIVKTWFWDFFLAFWIWVPFAFTL